MATVLRSIIAAIFLTITLSTQSHAEVSQCAYSCERSVPHQNYWDQTSIADYLRATDLPAMTELTACFYYDPAGLPPTSDPWLISIASETYDNDWVLGSMGRNGLSMHVESDANTITNDLEAFDSAHKHCFVWSDGNYLKWFYDKTTPGALELAAQVGDSGKQVIRAGSALVLLNDQDSLGGKLVDEQMTPGHIADFQLWDKAFSDAEVQALKCGLLGNVVRFEDMEVVGESRFHHGEDFQCACLMM